MEENNYFKTDKIAVGQTGEGYAAWYLEQKGYTVLHRNWTAVMGELDIVAKKGDTVVFVEVKRRMSLKYGRPCVAVGPQKQFKLSQLAACYIKKYQLFGLKFRFDIIEILVDTVNHIENAFYSKIKF